MTKNEVAQAIFDYWTKQSDPADPIIKPTFKPAIAYGVIGNEAGEYSLKWPPDKGDHKHGAGIAQWHVDRRQRILNATGIDVKTADLIDQQRAMWWELRHVYHAGLQALLAAERSDDVEEGIKFVVEGLVDRFEFSHDRDGDKAKRLEYARFWRDYFQAPKAT